MHYFGFSVFSILSLLGGLSRALSSTPQDVNTTKSPAIKSTRAADTCADPSLTQTMYQSYSPGSVVHVLNFLFAFENSNTRSPTIGWADLHPSFRIWPTQQISTVPLFQLGTADRTQYIYRIGADSQTPPIVSGFNTDVALMGWVYDSQVCGSVPLFSAVLAAFTDHYFTTNAFEHNGLISAGWVDGGVVAFVLPF